MHKIVRTERCGDGINVIWEKNGKEVFLYFSFTRLVDIQVNALDILENPRNYGFDEKTKRLASIV
ncbi:MAG: hypothetical protein LUQ60_06150 [Methanomicrobiales archaeon]|nr:hypothetical protein [Methanomicrobiales archaeon]